MTTTAVDEEITVKILVIWVSHYFFFSHVWSDVVVGVKNSLMTILDMRDGKFLGHSVYPSRLTWDYGFLSILWLTSPLHAYFSGETKRWVKISAVEGCLQRATANGAIAIRVVSLHQGQVLPRLLSDADFSAAPPRQVEEVTLKYSCASFSLLC